CHRLAYIAAGRLLASGTPAELVAGAGLSTWDAHGPGAAALAPRLEAMPGVELVPRFGNAIHVSGRDAAALQAAVAQFADAAQWQALPPTLEDVFIFLMRGAEAAPAKKVA
ncbi:MAG: ABC transporter ATP-binding protein, partial [Burkholderiaceae bacterium]